jgi:hypothetical protein
VQQDAPAVLQLEVVLNSECMDMFGEECCSQQSACVVVGKSCNLTKLVA